MRLRLIGDIGGTHARFALAEPGGTPRDERKLTVAEHPGLLEAAAAYLAGRPVEEAVFAVAAPVLDDAVTFTNSPWRFTISAARDHLGLRRLEVINDFVAQASAIACLEPADLRVLKPGIARPGRPRVVIGPGTGLGIAFLMEDAGRMRVLASEAGHSSFAAQDALQAALLARLQQELGHVSRERLLSGPGLLRLAQALAEIRGEPLELPAPTAVSVRAAERCPICLEAIRIFSAILGATAGDMALTLLAEGGVHVTGGLCRTLGPLLDLPALTEGFTAKGRFADYLQAVPISQVMRPHAGLLGAAAHQLP